MERSFFGSKWKQSICATIDTNDERRQFPKNMYWLADKRSPRKHVEWKPGCDDVS